MCAAGGSNASETQGNSLVGQREEKVKCHKMSAIQILSVPYKVVKAEVPVNRINFDRPYDTRLWNIELLKIVVWTGVRADNGRE